MSAIKAGKISSNVKSRTKSVLATLERLSSSSSPDKDQTRYLCHKLLQLVNEHETSKSDVTSKAGLDVILLTLESCSDQTTCHALVSTLAELASEGHSSMKRLISHDASRVLLHTLSYMGAELDWRLLSAIITLLSKLAPKDRRFALRARLTGALSMILTAVRSSYNHHSRSRLLPASLTVLKACLVNSPTNASLLGRAGAVNVLFKVSTSLSKKHPLPLKTSMATLNLLIRLSRANVSRAVNLGVMPLMLAMHQDYHKHDFSSNRHIAIRKSVLNVIKNTAALKSGRKAFLESDGTRILYTSCKDYLAASCTNKLVDCLLCVASLTLRRCQQKCRLPVPNLRCTFQFPLPGDRERYGSVTSVDLFVDESEDDDEFDEDDDENISGAVGEQDDVGETSQGKRRASAVSKASTTSDSLKEAAKRGPVLRAHEDLKMYEGFFPELTEFLNSPDETEWNPSLTSTSRPHSSCELQRESAFTRHRPSGYHSYPDLTHAVRRSTMPRADPERSPRSDCNPWEIPCNLGGTSRVLKSAGTEDRNSFSPRMKLGISAFQGIHGTSPRRSSFEQFDFNCGDDGNAFMKRMNPATAWTRTSPSADDTLPPQKTVSLPQISIAAAMDASDEDEDDILKDFKKVFERGLSEEHEDSMRRMRQLASRTISAKEKNNRVSMADQWGSAPPLKPEPQVNKKSLQRLVKAKVLEDVARFLFPDEIIHQVVYPVEKSPSPVPTDEVSADNFVNGGLYACDVHLPADHVTRNHTTVTIPTGLESIDAFSRNDAQQESGEKLDTDTSSATLSEDTWPGAYIERKADVRKGVPSREKAKPGLSNGFGKAWRDVGHAGAASRVSPALRFDSSFESGNLRSVTRVREFEYDLVLNSDCNSNHHFQWFYFEVSGMIRSRPYRFNIVNCEKKGSVINEGMQPVMYSVVDAKLGRPCWRRVGRETCYYRNHFRRHSTSAGATKSRTYFTLTFTITFQHEDDVCYLAYHYPYTYTKLEMDLNDLMAGTDPETMFVRKQTFCKSLAGNPLPLLTITALPRGDSIRSFPEAVEEMRSRPYIFLTARVHPGESNASWTMRGTLRLLLTPPPPQDVGGIVDDAKHTLAAVADELRRSYIFKIVPMLNPDGVINGHHRCSLSGEDLNRTWIDPSPELFPTIYHTKGLLQYLQSIQKAPLVYCDYHGHSRKMNVFLYGCSHRDSIASGEASTVVDGPDDVGYKTLPKLLNHLAPTFSLKNCSFVVERAKASTARVVVWKEIGVTRSYTMESTYCGCDQGQFRGKQISTRELEEMGSKFCEVLLHLKVRNKTRGLPVFEFDEDGITNHQEQNDDDNVSKPQQVPGCPANSDAELTPDEEDLSPLGGSFFTDDFHSPPSVQEKRRHFQYDQPSSSKVDLSFWRYDPSTISADFHSDVTRSNPVEAAQSAYPVPEVTVMKPCARPIRGEHGRLPVINAKVSPETGRLLSYEYGEADTAFSVAAPRPFESGLVLKKDRSSLKQTEQRVTSELLITPITTLGRAGAVDTTDTKTARGRRRSLKR